MCEALNNKMTIIIQYMYCTSYIMVQCISPVPRTLYIMVQCISHVARTLYIMVHCISPVARTNYVYNGVLHLTCGQNYVYNGALHLTCGQNYALMVHRISTSELLTLAVLSSLLPVSFSTAELKRSRSALVLLSVPPLLPAGDKTSMHNCCIYFNNAILLVEWMTRQYVSIAVTFITYQKK